MSDLSHNHAAMESALIFRVILDAMAKPCTPQNFHSTSGAPSPLFSNTSDLVNTLCDFQSAIWLSASFDTPDVTRHIKFNTGAPIVNIPREATFAILTAQQVSEIGDFNLGTDEYPDRSTTLLIQVDGFDSDDVELSGPGLKLPISFGAAGLGVAFWAAMIVNHNLYPLGVDVIFISPTAIACCPRSTRIKIKDHR